jgi:C4-dicarboxylate-binding protein DctP
MPSATTRRTFVAAALAAPAVMRQARAEPEFRLRCSVETGPLDALTLVASDFLAKIEASASGRLRAELFHSGILFSDQNAVTALMQDQVEMAIPPSLTVSRTIPNAAALQLPVMYGRPVAAIHAVTDGRSGVVVAAEIETRLKSHVLGLWLDVGFDHWFAATKKLGSLDDLRGLKVWVAAGPGFEWRARWFQAIPETASWAEVPQSLTQGKFDGLIGTNGKVASASLWQSGVKYSLQDYQFFGTRIPIISGAFWRRLPEEIKLILTATWAVSIEDYRGRMAIQQAKARAAIQSNKIALADITPEEISMTRGEMMREQDRVAHALNISGEMLRAMHADLEA